MHFINKVQKIVNSLRIFAFDYKKDLIFSTLIKDKRTDREMLLSSIVVAAHTLEKGLTMPKKRFPFGEVKAKMIADDCIEYVKRHYDISDARYIDVIAILSEYRDTHVSHGIDVGFISEKVDYLINSLTHEVYEKQRYSVNVDEYFSNSVERFDIFSNSRHSCRNLTGHIDDAILQSALALSMNTPSTCNRQSHRVHLLQSEDAKKMILTIQTGCRGFGDLADQFILVTSDLRCWPSEDQRHGPYVDGGIYLMNLLYCLHHNKIGACTLNMYLDKKRTIKLHHQLNISENEVPIALIAIGIPPKQFDLARSHRRSISDIVTIH